jgi:ParB-like chromosome segregation protein Spo0J
MSASKRFGSGPSLAERMRKKKEEQRNAGTSTAEPVAAPSPAPKEPETAEAPASKGDTPSEILRSQTADSNVDQSVQMVEVDLIDVEAQVRRRFNQEYIEDLATDFALDENNQPNQPITVWKRDNGRYLLDTGENRLRAMRFAAEHRKELGITDPTAFTTIRATIKGPEPGKLERLQSQTKENVLRDSLNDVELGYAAKAYLDENPNASQKQVAEWMGFRKLSSGRVRVSNALKLLRSCDKDLVEKVEAGELSTQNAFKVQDEREKEKGAAQTGVGAGQGDDAGKGKSKADQTLARATSKKKSTNVSVPLDALKTACLVIGEIAEKQGVDLGVDLSKELDRKTAVQVIQQERLEALLAKLKK